MTYRQQCIVALCMIAFFSASADSGERPVSERPASCPTLTDAAGRVLSLYTPYKRIISLYCAHTENLLSMGAKSRLIGATVCRSLAHADDLPPFSAHDGIEKFLAAAPDLILIRPMIDRAHARLFDRLEHMGITIASLQPDGPDELVRYWRHLGQLAGCEAAAETAIQNFSNTTRQIAKNAPDPGSRKHVYFISRHRQMRTFSDTSMALYVLAAAGGIHVATDAVPSRGSHIARYTKEKLLAKAGQIDVILVQTGRMNTVTRDEILNEPGFSAIPAVQRGDIFFVDEAIVSRPTFRLTDGMRTVGAILYPDRFTGEQP
ncbi:MAG: peptide ABC transporter substrate-binding protein [Deltaproteobacteria bacterium]|nr:MAG: peptide ABC transporter substrate-binding protein [Deltaproteobacteria bacterium]